MFRKIATAATIAALTLLTRAPSAHAQKALVYCPVGIDASGCDRIVGALTPKYAEGVDRGYDGSAGTVDLSKVDLHHYSVFVVPSLADDGDKQPYALLRRVASKLHYAINGRVAVYSGAPDQGNSNRADKDALIQNLAKWASDGHTRKTGLVGMVAFLDLSENESARYSWVHDVSLVDVSADTEDQSIGAATPVGTRGSDLLKVNGRQLAFSNMASNGLHIGNRGAARTEIGAIGGSTVHQSVLVTYSNADGAGDKATKAGSSGGASYNLSAGKASLDVTGSANATSGAILTTNKPDYQPGDTVVFTGSGFAPGDTVTITVHEDPTWSYPDRQFKSVADAGGAFVNRQMIVDQQDLNATFTATAVGNPSGTVAQTTFTDSKVNNSPTIGAQSPGTVNPGGSATYNVTVHMNGNGNACPVLLSVSGLPTGATYSFDQNPFTWPGGTGDFTRVLTVTTAVTNTAGTSTITITATDQQSGSPPSCQDNSAASATASLTIAGKANQTITFTSTAPTTAVFGGTYAVAATGGASGNAVTFGTSTPLVCTAAGSTINFVGVGNCTVTADQAGNTNFNPAMQATQSFTIAKATSATGVSCPASVTFTGSPLTPCTATVTGAGGLSLTPTPTYTDNTNAGTASASYAFAGDANHTGSTDSKTFTIDKAPSTTAVTCTAGPFTYTGSPVTPCSATVTGAGGLNQTALVPAYTDNTNAGTASASYTFAGDANHLVSSDSKTFTIGKASSSTVVSCTAGPFTYTGSPQTPCSVSVTGAGGLNQTATPTYTNNTNAGTATADYTFAGDANHTGSNDSKTFTIGKASSTTVVACTAGPFTYDGTLQTPCSVAVTGAGGLSSTPTPTYTNNSNAGTATASYTFAGDANHTGSTDSKDFTIDKAASTTAVSCPASATYTGSPITPCTAAATGAGGLNVPVTPISYSTNTNVGTAGASATFVGDANHLGSSGTGSFGITKATSATVITCPTSVPYDGTAQTPCTVAVTGAGGLSLTPNATYTNNTNAGTASASYSFAGDANHDGSTDSKTFTIAKAASLTTVSCPVSVVYTGSVQTPCSVTVTGAGGLSLAPTPSYTNNTSAGTASASYTYAGDANHDGSTDTKTFTIAKAASTTTVSCTAGPFTYTGSPQTPCSVSVTGAGGLSLAPTPSYIDNTNAGTATASYTYAGDANHDGSTDSKTFTIAKAPSATAVTCAAGPFTYTGSPQTPCSASVTGVGGLNLTPTATYTDNTNAGTATASYTYAGDANHLGSTDSKTFTIGKASSATVVSCTAGPFTYDGTAQTPCSAAVTGAGGLNLTPTPTYTNNTNAGTATASYTYGGDANHIGSSDSKTFTIDKASSTTVVSCAAGPFTYTGNPQTPCSVSVTGAGGLNDAPPPTYANNTNAGTATAGYIYAGDANHTGSNDSKTFIISKASSTTTVNCPVSVTYNGSAQTPCSATATGVGGLSSPVTPVSYTNNANAGTASATATYAGDANHDGSTGNKTFTIAKADQTITWSNPADIVYGTALGATQLNATVAGVLGGSAPGMLTYTPAAGTILHAGARTLTVDAAATANYNAATKQVSITVLQAPASVTITNLVQAYTGTARSAVVTTSPASLSVNVAYTDNGVAATPIDINVYKVTATITDPDYVGTDTELFVIYDASAGFVTGGGWIDSPAGAYAANPALVGKANFGFNSKYQKGANVPTGNTEFQFQAGNLNFSSTDFQWLVVQGGGNSAQFKGTGTINGAGRYNFMVTAVDGDNSSGAKKPDSFRMKITTLDGLTVIYDNWMGKDDSGVYTTVLGGGSIVIHDK